MTTQEIINLLKRRGFFIELEGSKIVLSDNSHKDDLIYLSKILNKYDIGNVRNDEIYITNQENGYKLKSLFNPTEPIISEESWYNIPCWQRFRRYHYGVKVPVCMLEANIAYYCKALSACGLNTASSCDANHSDPSQKLFIRFEYTSYNVWHKLLWKHILNKRFNLEWADNYFDIHVDTNTREYIYDQLYKAADFLYNNRVEFRDLKNRSSNFLTKSYCKNHSDMQIELQLEQNLISILNEYQFSKK